MLVCKSDRVTGLENVFFETRHSVTFATENIANDGRSEAQMSTQRHQHCHINIMLSKFEYVLLNSDRSTTDLAPLLQLQYNRYAADETKSN